MLWSLADVANALVLNRPSAMQSNHSKPYQSQLIEEQGFRVPETLITTDISAAHRFWKKHGEVIYKSISGNRSIVSKLHEEHAERMNNLRWCPTQFQRRIRGVDYRVHIVGTRLFASQILSEAVDYRYSPACIEACELPDDVAERCLRLSQVLDLNLAGLDLLKTPEGEWYCFEINPSPAYSYYESATGQLISLAIANLLAGKRV